MSYENRRIDALARQSQSTLDAVGGVDMDHPSTLLVFTAAVTRTSGNMTEVARRLANPQ